MKGLLQGIPTLLLSPGKSEIHRLLLPKLYARCMRVVVPLSKEPRIMAPFESETFIAIGTRRLNPSSVNFCYPIILSLENLTLYRQVKAVPIHTLLSCTLEYTNDLATPPILKHGNPIWAISIIPIDEFNPISVVTQPISSDRIDYFLQPISCQKFFTDHLEFIQPFVAHHQVEIVGARINKFDSDVIAMQVELDEPLHFHLNMHALVKIESALQAVRISRFEVSVLKSSVFEDNRFYAMTASIKTEFAYHSISTKIQYCEDFIQLSQPNVHAHSHKNPLLQPPNKKPNVLPPINRGGQPRAITHFGRNAKQDPPMCRSLREKSEILCERHGVLWRFMDENERELQNFGWQNEINWFKLSGQNLNRGRLVKHATNGFYLLVVPSNWTCINIESSCLESKQPDQLATDLWHGYFSRIDHNKTIFPRFETSTGSEMICEWKRTHFIFEGNHINDAFSHLGPLFGLNPPMIKANLTSDWHEIGTIVLGQEGTGRNKARWELFPQRTQQVQDLLPKHLVQRSGWYFLRFYDRDDNLLESFDFRFVANLTEIIYSRNLLIPSTDGHESTKIVLRHIKPLSIKSEQHELLEPIRISETETHVIVPPEPVYDSSEWCFNEKVPIKFELNRLWWGVAAENAEEINIEWQDKPFELEESRFDATSSETLWLKRPRNAKINSFYYGFEYSSKRELSHAHRGGNFSIPLREFESAPDIKVDGTNFQFWISELGSDGTCCEHEVTVFRIKKKKWHCKILLCSFLSETWLLFETHFREMHSEYGFRILEYTEAQARGLYGKEFPSKIYQCPYNPEHFVDATCTFSSSNSLITYHVERECEDARKYAHTGHIKVGFKVVESVERIRQVHLPTLPIWVQCHFCDGFFKKSVDDLSDDIYLHLLKTHREELFEVK